MKTLEQVLETWEPVIGLEIHTELTTLKSKMFCGCPIDFGAAPNEHTCPGCLGLPGALPVPNQAAIESIILAGLATNCDIEKETMFYRKNYFYADMSQNFQTTQGAKAFCMRGGLELELDGKAAQERTDLMVGLSKEERKNFSYTTRIGITRIHMEEDAGKLVHVGGVDGRITGASHSLVDYNRVCLPLIELVTEPDLRSPEEARHFMQKLRQIFLTLGISDCSMEEGSMRCDGNISLRRRGTTKFGTKTELKNMNSFKNLHDGLVYEICRQAEVLESGGTIQQETRHWEPANKRTISMRVKETADDYRYFPEPNLTPFVLEDSFIESIRARLPELPDQKKARYMADFGLTRGDAAALVADKDVSAYFEAAMAAAGENTAKLAKPVANLINNELAGHLNAAGIALADAAETLPAAALVELAALIAEDAISSKQGKEVFAAMLETGKSAAAIVEERGMKQVSDTGALEAIVDEIIAANPAKVAEYQGGKTGLIGFFVGQAMKATQGQGNPKLINQLFTAKLS